MRKLLVAGNWKMNGSRASIDELVQGVLAGLDEDLGVDVAVFPPFPYLGQVQDLLQGSDVAYGGQTMNPNEKGAFTGETAASMLLDFGCAMVLVGHSERRNDFQESDADVAERFQAALKAGLHPVLCIGETMSEREGGETESVIDRQVQAVLDIVGIEGLAHATIAYEPVWAIGTGLTATPDQAQAVHAFIRDKLTALDGTIGGQIRILYGGSVNASNAADLFSQADIDGALVGGASLTADAFLGICRNGA